MEIPSNILTAFNVKPIERATSHRRETTSQTNRLRKEPCGSCGGRGGHHHVVNGELVDSEVCHVCGGSGIE